MHFYLEARRTLNGRMVEFVVNNGTRAGNRVPLGLISFTPEEWEAFRPVIIGGMRAAGYLRTPIEFMDQTRKKRTDLKSVN